MGFFARLCVRLLTLGHKDGIWRDAVAFTWESTAAYVRYSDISRELFVHVQGPSQRSLFRTIIENIDLLLSCWFKYALTLTSASPL